MNGAFDVQSTSRFDRELKKLARAHPNAMDEFAAILPALRTDRYNQTRRFPIKKLKGVKPGEGQYRIRIHRFRFLYDIEGRIVF